MASPKTGTTNKGGGNRKARPPLAAARKHARDTVLAAHQDELADAQADYLAAQGWATRTVTVEKWEPVSATAE